MDFLKGLQAFDVEKVLEQASNAVQAVDEFPGSNQPKLRVAETIVTVGAVNRARMAQTAWEKVDLEVSPGVKPMRPMRYNASCLARHMAV